MRDHELELLAALAEGRLEDDTEARALIASSPEARAEYVAQKTAHDSLSGLGRATLTDDERAALRRDIWTSFRTPEAGQAGSGRWYTRWVPVVAGLFVVVGAVAVINQTGMLVAGDATAEDGGDTIAATASTAAAASGEALGGLAEEDETTEMARSSDTSSTTQSLASAPEAEADFYRSEAQSIRSGDEEQSLVRLYEYSAADTDLAACLDAADLDGYVVHGVYEAERAAAEASSEIPNDPFIASIPDGVELESAPIAFVDLETCVVDYFDDQVEGG